MASSKPNSQTVRPTTGTVIAEKHRARLNSATDDQRSALYSKGMQLIYGNSHAAKTPVGSR